MFNTSGPMAKTFITPQSVYDEPGRFAGSETSHGLEQNPVNRMQKAKDMAEVALGNAFATSSGLGVSNIASPWSKHSPDYIRHDPTKLVIAVLPPSANDAESEHDGLVKAASTDKRRRSSGWKLFGHGKDEKSDSVQQNKKGQDFVMKQVSRDDYDKFYRKDESGKFSGTADWPAEDCILKDKDDLRMYRGGR